ncbi:transcription factor Ouib-like isoform X2 [Bombyx mandarina]|uniref:Uncharacterized protein n=2 Tax=Bombyx TaxID=7090 RepID=A0A8R1WL18_BOMMO|nr:transcription factor Ouib isoform X2 [Bombyx mori]XP_028033543.1 transcription factor Ouib-like isoform X2 [Bombyx mandarina]
MQHNSVMCRICFRSENNITRLFSDSSVSKGILDKFYLCFQIVMNPEKDLPDGICNQCLKILENVNCFRIMCITIYERFADFRKSFTREMNASKCREDEKDELALHEDKFLEVKTETEGTLLDNNKQTSNFFKCQICDKVLKTMNSLSKHSISMHQNRKHAGTVTGNGIYRLYHCTTCTYSTPHSQTLINHMRRHNGERPFVCILETRSTNVTFVKFVSSHLVICIVIKGNTVLKSPILALLVLKDSVIVPVLTNI